ncbi:MAG: hypothetical protein U5N85_17970 [Arcicella sp.]|nr:hypothetical protein [Arcicella sp.]
MQTLTIQTNNSHAIGLLEELAALNLIEVINKSNNFPKKQKLSDRLWGSISSETAKKMNEELEQTRNEWERNT